MPFELKDVFHVDPITIVVLIAGFYGTWITLKKDSRWHTQWIKHHDVECNEIRKKNNETLSELKQINAHLTTMVDQHEKRLDRMEVKK